MDCTVIIPAYRPPVTLPRFLEELRLRGFSSLILVDDGSGEHYHRIFRACKKEGTVLLHHNKNKGKGEALKTAFRYCVNHEVTANYIITADCDGQHLVDDIEKLFYTVTAEKNNTIVLGARKFDDTMPYLSRIGNAAASRMMKQFFRMELPDTQTGLRAFSSDILPFLLKIPGKRYEYETNMLIHAAKYHIPILSAEIRSIYFNKNRESHYRPFRDSLRVTAAITAQRHKYH